MEDTGAARFAHLLQPIRDLSQNWEIDIASLLADYLEEIDKIAITFDGGVTTMNFAEAALLIQGSASIYSKKIEYLYTLVYQTLNLLASNKQMEQGMSVDESGRDKDTTFDKNKRKDEEFLALDDIRQGNSIDLADIPGDHKSVSLLPRAPISLVPLGDVEKKNNALLSRTGDLLGSRKDFRMNTCACHTSGALLMDYSDLALVPRTLTPPPQMPLSEDDDMRHGVPAEGQTCGPGDFPAEGSMAMPPPPALLDDPNELDATFPSPPKDAGGGIADAPAARTRRVRMAAQPSAFPPIRDPWEILDPHETSTQAEQKVYRRGRPFRVPAVLSKKAVTKKRPHDDNIEDNADANLMPLLEFCRLAFQSQSSRFPSNFLKAPSFADFEELFWAEQKRRRELLKKEREMYKQRMSRDEEEYAFDDKEYSDDEDDAHVAFQPGRSSLGGAAGLPGHHPHVGPAGGDGIDGDDMDDGAAADDGGIFSGLTTYPTDGIPPMSIEEGGLSNFVVSSYEDLVRQHVDGFITSANQYLKESDLARRVREWEERIKPVLDEEETHPPYDIHAYGWQVLQGFDDSDAKEKIDFARIAAGKEQFEVCRLFLASLQLANNRNVDIVCGSDERNSMQMKLLQTEQIHTKLQQYQAPSLVDP